MSRKDTLRAMLTRRTDELPGGNSSVATPPATPLQHVRAGAVGAMGRSLEHIASAAERAKALIASGASVIEIAPDKLTSSFAQDRLDDEGIEQTTLYTAIKESGQKSPILVRPDPSKAEHFQIAYGHRRARILRLLDRPVRAVVQNLSDEELVVIQGQENSARKDLSYIERGLFALTLEERGFERAVIMSALSMEKTQLSRLLALTKSISKDLIVAIGPASKAGRPRWTAFAERLEAIDDRSRLDGLLSSPEFKDADSDQRFLLAFGALAPRRPTKEKKVILRAEAGERIATIERTKKTLSVVVDTSASSAFGEFVAAQLPELFRQFQSKGVA
ncbi:MULTISPECIES: plasmid partitioning protein RepB [unclassified Bosea (in: a-proteobacteria)]|uniref:plasmid partitioning protein RepB n=1 Tax=unclassified Bosea (in: a-proteobacteria) TaxID=2653178 RepID=UPI000F763E3D|nr:MULTISPECIES: plasmid partitioning protein RepB [unclassified Bosea (in: a-proteobacteria)]AZO82101.1 plasmid partitioning protein RepB [Bosea sp. Tri-49]RXT24677.1 plasmid partitioning protein RepB [Bosea sp. Tri-39]RXT42512.1 plasmid partitioning protein RepB [Bosea sp. Tri-54]